MILFIGLFHTWRNMKCKPSAKQNKLNNEESQDEALDYSLGENGSEVVLSDEDEKKYKLQIESGYKRFAFNEFISSLISTGADQVEVLDSIL